MPGKLGTYQDPNEKKIEDARKAGKILDWTEFKSQDMRDALARLNKRDADKNKSASQLATEEAKKRGLPGYKKGGTVKKTGLALVHKGEKVIPSKKAKKMKKKSEETSEKISQHMASMYSKK